VLLMDHKEILTDKHIQTDLRRMVTLWDIALHVVLVLLTLFIFIGCFCLYYVGFMLLAAIPAGFLLFIAVKFTVDTLIRFFRYRPIAVSCQYTVTVDTMTHIEKNTNPFFYHKHWPRVCFATYKPFLAIGQTRYTMHLEKWHVGFFSNACEGDTFYIVTDDGKTPLMVYNTKFFEYKGDKEGNAL